MKFASVPARWLGSLALCFLPWAGAQTLPLAAAVPSPEELAAQQSSGQPLAPDQPQATPQRFEQAWDVVELMGQPMLTDAQRSARIVIRPQGSLLVDGGCNYFSGRIERDVQGLFRISKYGGTHGGCDKPPRSEAFLNSALVMVDNYRWDRGLVLRSGANDLVRLQPSASQDSQDIEQALASRAATAASPAPLSQAVQQDCRKVKVAQSRNAKGRHAKAAATRLVCKPAATRAAHQGARPAGKSRATKTLAKGKVAGKAKATARAKPAAGHGQHKTPGQGQHKR